MAAKQGSATAWNFSLAPTAGLLPSHPPQTTMGLSGNKKRSKLSQDPNNTAWSRNTTTFGHKILSKQGWKPGDYLGAENATHSDHYTAANASHIRVMLREENLGLGAQIGRGNAETFGLSMFSGLLGRLNGKSDGEVQKQQEAIRDMELRAYTGPKFGFMNFISGGLLVGDEMQPSPDSSSAVDEKRKSREVGSSSSKKRKAIEEEEVEKQASTKKRMSQSCVAPDTASIVGVHFETKLRKSKSKDEKRGEDDASSGSESSSAAVVKKKKAKKGKRETREALGLDDTLGDEEKKRSKEEKRARKEERRRRKQEKAARKARIETTAQESTQTSTLTSETEGTATPPLQQIFGGRQAVRQRYIQQKRMASMDPKALKEIFMMQTKAAA